MRWIDCVLNFVMFSATCSLVGVEEREKMLYAGSQEKQTNTTFKQIHISLGRRSAKETESMGSSVKEGLLCSGLQTQVFSVFPLFDRGFSLYLAPSSGFHPQSSFFTHRYKWCLYFEQSCVLHSLQVICENDENLFFNSFIWWRMYVESRHSL